MQKEQTDSENKLDDQLTRVHLKGGNKIVFVCTWVQLQHSVSESATNGEKHHSTGMCVREPARLSLKHGIDVVVAVDGVA